ncbi:pyruvate dehydrogenase (acetyl-transferring) E1 component subunit alpha [Mycobacterium kyogaense]|uniref:pyruvate dehydrogenase (acetyl-transferring) E1 component subunit alpha n=1 Tax=Mycobacterium kyogaense TaxID=2212479 RepID=UPI000DAC68E7|nr:pyruvate dehydrogenase (acetyl-transferring) E1 component subunit alpha [Mycobacterium kyogaense]
MIERDVALPLLTNMIRVRLMEEKCAELYSAGKIRGFLHLYVGEEAVAAGSLAALEDLDAVVATYRDHAHALLRGIPMTSIMAEMFGKQEGCSRGRGGSMHLFDARTRFFGGNAIVGGGLPVAVGLALADAQLGRSRVTACYFGEGAVAEGAFHEAMNLAALWQVPVLFCCENNYYAMGTELAHEQAETDMTEKAASYRIPALAVDGMDVLACRAAALEGAYHVRNGGGPFFLEFRTYRFRPHSMFDPELYRSREEVEHAKERDPISTFTARCVTAGVLGDDDVAGIRAAVAEELADAVAYAEAGTWEPVGDLTRDVLTPAEAAR